MRVTEGYTVFSPNDINDYFNDQNRDALNTLSAYIAERRAADGKSPRGAVTVVEHSNPVITQVRELLDVQELNDREHFFSHVTPTHLLIIIQNGNRGAKSDYFDGYTTTGTSDADYAHFTRTGSVWSPANNMVQAMNLAAQFGIMVSAIPVARPISVVINGELESYELAAGEEADYSTRLNNGVLFAVRRLLEAQYNVAFV
jgi:hypothetical protein